MGKFVIIPYHPSNTFFEQFPNSLMYKRKEEFVSQLKFALSNEPTPLSSKHFRTLTWEAATERLILSAVITQREEKRRIRVAHNIDEKAKLTLKGPFFIAFQRKAFSTIGMSPPEENESVNVLPVASE